MSSTQEPQDIIELEDPDSDDPDTLDEKLRELKKILKRNEKDVKRMLFVDHAACLENIEKLKSEIDAEIENVLDKKYTSDEFDLIYQSLVHQVEENLVEQVDNLDIATKL